jgi:ATP-dependent Zn protease
VAVLTSPALFLLLYRHEGWGLPWAILGTVLGVAAFRGLVDVLTRKLIPWPSLFGTDDGRLRAEDVMARRRVWFWRGKFRLLTLLGIILGVVFIIRAVRGEPVSVGGAFSDLGTAIVAGVQFIPTLGFYVVFLFLVNILILFGPMLYPGIKQIQGYEPGDADWGVRMADVRGQAEAKEEVRRIVSLWQSGDEFERAGGKRERGILFLGAPGTGKTMLAKAVATGFNCPFVTIPGSGFAQTFIGLDVIIVQYMAWKARRLARKWGGQCIVFIDEIDAVGMRRASLGGIGAGGGHRAPTFEEICFFGPNGALTPTGDLVLETRAWRERLFAERAPGRASLYPPLVQRMADGMRRFMMPGGYGGMGQGGLQQLLVTMDGVDTPPLLKRWFTRTFNTTLDALYVVPQRIGSVPLRRKPPRPRPEQIYFVGACNVPIEQLDPALTRPGRMGRHVWFRTPTQGDRRDIFNLYLAKVAHEPDLDGERRRDELARITNGYSPAMIEQVCSMALTIAHHDGRRRFGYGDIVEAMTTVESGTAVGIEYAPDETRAVAVHEAGHAIASHVYMKDALSTRLSIRKRGDSLGHHQALETRERFSSWRHEEVARLIWTLGAMAAERVFYGENSTGVGGDVMSATARAAWMVGSCAMSPEPVDLGGRFATEWEEEKARRRITSRYEAIGVTIMRRAGEGGPMGADPIAGVLADPAKRAAAAQLLGQAYVTAHWLVEANREAIERITEALVERREIHGDDVVDLLDRCRLRAPQVDVLDESVWPRA